MTTCIYKKGRFIAADKRTTNNHTYVDDSSKINVISIWNTTLYLTSCGGSLSNTIENYYLNILAKDIDTNHDDIHLHIMKFMEGIKTAMHKSSDNKFIWSEFILVVINNGIEKAYDLVVSDEWGMTYSDINDVYVIWSWADKALAILSYINVTDTICFSLENIFKAISKCDNVTSSQFDSYELKWVEEIDLSDIPF